MQDAWRAYIELALGLTEASRKKATKAAKKVLGKTGATAEQIQGIAEDLVKTSMANREAITKLVRYELDRALGVVGLATAEEVADLTARVRDLEQQLQEAQARTAVAEPTGAAEVAVGVAAVPPASKASPRTGVKKAAPTRTVAKKTVAKKTVAKKTAPARKSASS